MNPPILVTGCGRSGSSMIAGVLNICGAYWGTVNSRNENLRIRSMLTDYFRSLKVDPDGQYPLPNLAQINLPYDWADRVSEAMRRDGYKGGPWLIKGSRLALTWPVWDYAFPDAKWLIVRRRTGDIIRGCLKTRFMNAFSNPKNVEAVGASDESGGWLWWVHQFEQRFVDMITEGMNCRIIWPERMVNGDYTQIMESVSWLGLQWKSEVLSYIDPRLWKSRARTTERISTSQDVVGCG